MVSQFIYQIQLVSLVSLILKFVFFLIYYVILVLILVLIYESCLNIYIDYLIVVFFILDYRIEYIIFVIVQGRYFQVIVGIKIWRYQIMMEIRSLKLVVVRIQFRVLVSR